jgi:cupin fold WbuC family metalloprotein
MKRIDRQLLDDLTAKAAVSPRKRAHHNIHPVLEDPVQRLCVAIEPGTYIRPHRHADPSTWEVFILLRGSAVFLVFDDAGKVEERVVLKAGGPVQAIEIPAAAWHSIASLERRTIFLEVKQGPYSAPKEKNSAAWAPAEGEVATARFEAWYRNASVGDGPPELS